jgi:transcriptional regulator with XRE-family HTH domain
MGGGRVDFAQALKETRERKGIMIKDLAKMTGIPYYNLVNWEHRKAEAKLLPCKKLAAAFGVTLDEFAGMIDEG